MFELQQMEEKTPAVPIWPANIGGSPRRMCFLFAEARWYLWFQEENKQAISTLRRDLLMLHQNGDLKLFKKLETLSPGTYVTALHDGKMIRGRVCSIQKKSEVSKGISKYISVIDIDEGKTLELPMNQIRALPEDLMSLPCQAIRCDINLECEEQFDWPPEINKMLTKALDKTYLFVENTANRPGSIPTISGNVTVCNPATGESMGIQKWLMEKFSTHLDLCSLEKYKPFPVGMSAKLLEQSKSLLQQHVFGMNVQSMPHSMSSNMLPSLPPNLRPSLPPNMQSCLPPGYQPSLPLNMQSCLPPGCQPNLPLNMQPCLPPGYQQGFPSHLFHGMPLRMPQPSMPPNMTPNTYSMPQHMPAGKPPFQMGPPNLTPHQRFTPPLPPQFAIPGSTVRTSMISFQYSQSSTPSSHSSGNQSVPERSQKWPEGKNLRTAAMSTSNSSLSGAELHSSSVFESDISNESHSTVGIDLDVNLSSTTSGASSSSSLNPDVAPYIPKIENSITNPKRERAKSPTSSSSLSIDASPFVPEVHKPSKRVTASVGPKPYPNSSILEIKPKSPDARPVLATGAPKPYPNSSILEIKPKSPDARPVLATGAPKPSPVSSVESRSTPLAEPKPHAAVKSDTILVPSKSIAGPSMQAGPSSDFLKGPDVELVHIARDWKVGQVLTALMARVWNPSCFEVNVVDGYCELLSCIQEEMDEFYKSHKVSISSKMQAQDLCGNFCACYDPDENIWFRAEVEEWFVDDSITPVKAWAVDLGGFARVDISCIQPLTTELACTTPVLVTLCAMKNILPLSDGDIWPEAHLSRVRELLPDDKELYLRIDGPKAREEVWPVSVFTSPDCSTISINEILVSEGCAYYVEFAPDRNCSAVVAGEDYYEDSEDPMEEAYRIGGNNYEVDDEDACVAVSGRKPTEEIGICWFYNKHGYCYKNFCDLKHVRLNPDGHSIEKTELHTKSFEEIDNNVLAPGKQIKLTVTRILTVNHFIARMHLGRGTPGIKSRETLKSVIKNLNSPEMKRSLKAFTEYPADGEVVLYKDKTGTFYRGRIVGSDTVDDDLYEVLNVDTGYLSKVPMNNLRRVDPAFLHHPFQAIECWLADVSPTQTDREWTKTCNELFAELVRDQKVYATIVRSAPWGIEVNLFDKKGRDIVVALKEQGIVKSCPRRHLPTTQSHHIPG